MLSEVACLLNITIVGGSIPKRSGDKLYNIYCVFGTDGKLKAKHRKMHLFDIDIPGEIMFKESKTLTPGETPTIVDMGTHDSCSELISILVIAGLTCSAILGHST
ncbi:omega-amidase, chloroplastic-like isoform X2 [Olea europaea var. sylvestris]|uniref:omega-amidase, chloroplastic-like isoform X2 n=1 Tax=Olea europaea var. sylvestris TaxID=158386 RepID=UPI000C1D5785|nr:omega-amidase, chloroplastic-like isoform X2 [Olea europaea var. sylvestris]